MEPDPETGKNAFESVVMGGNIPTNFIPAIEKVTLSLINFPEDFVSMTFNC